MVAGRRRLSLGESGRHPCRFSRRMGKEGRGARRGPQGLRWCWSRVRCWGLQRLVAHPTLTLTRTHAPERTHQNMKDRALVPEKQGGQTQPDRNALPHVLCACHRSHSLARKPTHIRHRRRSHPRSSPAGGGVTPPRRKSTSPPPPLPAVATRARNSRQLRGAPPAALWCARSCRHRRRGGWREPDLR